MERLRTLTGNDCFVKSTTTLSAPLNDLVAAGTVPAIEGGIPAVRKGDLGTAVEAWHGELMGVRDANAWIVTLVDGEWTGLELRGTTSEGGATAWVAVDRISADAGCDGFDDG